MRNAYSNLDRKPGGKCRLGRPRNRGEDNIKMNPKDIRYEVVDCT